MNIYNFELDIRNEVSPYSLLRIKSLIDKLQKGDVVKIIADDPVALRDIEMWTEKSGNELLSIEINGSTYIIFIRRS